MGMGFPVLCQGERRKLCWNLIVEISILTRPNWRYCLLWKVKTFTNSYKNKRLRKLSNKVVLFCNNARPDSTILTQKLLRELQSEEEENSPYGADIYVLGRMKRDVPVNFFIITIRKLLSHYNKYYIYNKNIYKSLLMNWSPTNMQNTNCIINYNFEKQKKRRRINTYIRTKMIYS